MPEFTISLQEIFEIRGEDFDIGLSDYPIFDTAYRAGLNKKILDHYWNQEIGLETIELFVFNLRRKMNEIMPLYNQFYTSQLLAVDPFITFDTDSTTESESASVATNTSTSNSKARAASSEPPQMQLAENEDYATGVTDTVSDSENAGDANSTDTATGTVNTRGFSGAMSDLLLRYRDTFLNIDLQVIEECRELFMGLWSNGDETFSHGWWSMP